MPMHLEMPFARVVLALTLLLAGCGLGPATSPGIEPDPTGAVDPAPIPPVPDLSVLLAAVEDGTAGTEYAGAALEDPEVVIATARLLCELLDGGVPADGLVEDYAARWSSQPGDDDIRMVGVLLGASIEVVCPDHRDALLAAAAAQTN